MKAIKYIAGDDQQVEAAVEQLKDYTREHGGDVDIFRTLCRMDCLYDDEDFESGDYDKDELYEEHANIYVGDGRTEEAYITRIFLDDIGKLWCEFELWRTGVTLEKKIWEIDPYDIIYLHNLLADEPAGFYEEWPVVTVSSDDIAERYDVSGLSDMEKHGLLERVLNTLRNNDTFHECIRLAIEFNAEDMGLKEINK